ncbi:MAG: ATP-binding protein, partial [Bacillota bacterium]|nr:ATP-binding protein [Bacillota bacterium]
MKTKRSPKDYGNESISSLKGADRVRKRPAVIFGSDGIDGCQHSVFEILSNSIDEAREGYGDVINVTRFEDGSIEIEDFGRGIPLDYNQNEQRYNWELVFCELYAGGKYRNIEGESYEYSLGLNGLGSCATQYSSAYMDVTVIFNGFRYFIHFEKGENKTGTPEGFVKELVTTKKTGTKIRWKPDLDVFTDISVPLEYYLDTLKRQAVVNAGLRFVLKDQRGHSFETYEFCYENGVVDYLSELAGDDPLTSPQFIKTEKSGRDREDKPEYKVKMEIAFLFDKAKSSLEYYHN